MKINNSYVAVLDVLGFSDLVDNNSHESLSNIFNNFLTGSLQAALSGFKYRDNPSGEGVGPDLSQSFINSITVSDTVMLWTSGDTRPEFLGLLKVLSAFLQLSFLFGLPLRGAVSVGPIELAMGQVPASSIILQTRLLGKSIVDAHKLEIAQQWSGCIVDIKALECFEKSAMLAGFESLGIEALKLAGILVEYTVPMKTGSRQLIVVNWVRGARNNLDQDKVEEMFGMHNKLVTGDDVQLKMRNTIEFIESVRGIGTSR